MCRSSRFGSVSRVRGLVSKQVSGWGAGRWLGRVATILLPVLLLAVLAAAVIGRRGNCPK